MRYFVRVETLEGVFYQERGVDPQYEGRLITEAEYHAIKDKALTGLVTGLFWLIKHSGMKPPGSRDPF